MSIDRIYLALLLRFGIRTPKLRHLKVCHVYAGPSVEELPWSDYAKSVRHLTLIGCWSDEIILALEGRRYLEQLTLIGGWPGSHLAYFLCTPSSRFMEDDLEVQNLKKLKLVSVYDVKDANIQLLLDERNSSKYPRVPTMEFELVRCGNVTAKTVEALEGTGRGTCELRTASVFSLKRFMLSSMLYDAFNSFRFICFPSLRGTR